MIRHSLPLAILVLFSAVQAQAANVTLKFKGTIQSIVDAGDPEAPAINIPEIPVGSTFTGTISYDSTSPRTDGGNGYSRYVNMPTSTGSLTVNGHSFTTAGSTSATVVSKESGFGFSGVNLSTQPISLPNGWSVEVPDVPYFTLQFRDAPSKTRPLTLPTLSEYPTDVMNLILDFQIPLTIDGQTYGQRVYVTGHITSLAPPPQQVTINVDPTKINLNAKNSKPLKVTVFGSPSLNVQNVVTQSIGLIDPDLAGTGDQAPPVAVDYIDVNRDGRKDLVLSFSLLVLQEYGAIDGDSSELLFQATLTNEGLVFGSDAVTIAGAKGKKKK